MDWTLLRAIFCRPHTAVRIRSKLDAVEVCIGLEKETIEASEIIIRKETRQQLPSLLKEGLKLKLQVGKDKRDII